MLLSEIGKRRQTARKLINQLDPTLDRVIDIDDWETSVESFAEKRPDLNRGVLSELKKTLAQYSTLKLEYANCATDYDATQAAVQSSGPFSELYKRLCAQKLDELMSDKIFDAHFVATIDMLETTEKTAGYVVLFRYIVSVPGVIAPYLVKGMSTERIQADHELHAKLESWLDLSPGNVIGIISNVTSPHLEYIVQRFTQVFSRIGSPDFTSEYREQIRCACEDEK